jgi:thiamine biosynthesis protein ThiI
MIAINDVTNTPVIRPVITMDKNEIIEIAQEIDTFEISIQPFEDCCTIFAPQSPKTKPNLEHARAFEARMDIEGLIERAMQGLKISQITPTGEVGVQAEEDEFEDLL